MNVEKLFKIPSSSIPSGKNKRKLAANPNIEVLKAVREKTEEREAEFEPSESSYSPKGKTVRISDEVEEREYIEYEEYREEDREEEGRFYGGGLTDEQKKILDLMDRVEDEEPEVLNSAAIRKMFLKFEKAIIKNQELRVKYSDDPSKFMESEADLDEEIKHLLTLAEVPDLYPEIVQLGIVTHLVSLLSHENTDITIDVIELLNELTDEDVVAEHNEDAMKIFIDALLENQVLELLVQNISRLDEEEPNDKQGIFNTLGIIENLASFDPSLSERLIKDTNILEWMLGRIKVKAFDSNKQYCSEILSILLQNSRVNRLKLGELGGIDVLLQVLNAYKRRNPKDADETEMMENLFDALCLALTEPEIKKKFLEGEGVELMLIMMKEKMMSRMRSIKVLDHALSTPDGTSCCERFVEIFGLKTLFSAFMRKGLKKLKKTYKNFSEAEEEEHIIGIIVSLLKNLPNESEHRLRLVGKFIESDYEKVDRLLEMREGYESRVSAVDMEIEKEKEALEDDGETIDEQITEEFYLRRLDAGLFTLQLVDLTIAWVCYEDPKIKEHVEILLNRTGRSLANIKAVLEEYHNYMGDGGQDEVENPVKTDDSMEIDNEKSVTTTITSKERARREKEIVEMLLGIL
ncbi:17039_t:CDS:10 [Acaulospora morrowiae]|uniref:17039_t:CDS:1 n=1 Tax=Acaulospora morrowiae TaxID=94023 RepID=A0A9N9GF57_9GLOM|nr:17039_t:CDS:10 [Acaulospora morrowiae]